MQTTLYPPQDLQSLNPLWHQDNLESHNLNQVQGYIKLPRSGSSSTAPLDLKIYKTKRQVTPHTFNIQLWNKHRLTSVCTLIQREESQQEYSDCLENSLTLLAGFLKFVSYIFSFPYCGCNHFAKFSWLSLTKISSLLSFSFQHFPQLPQSPHDSLLEAWSCFLSLRPFRLLSTAQCKS